MKQIELTPNYAQMFTGFLRDAKNQSARNLEQQLAEAADEGWSLDDPACRAALLRVVQGVIAPLTIAIQCATTIPDIEAFREVMAGLLKDLDTHASRLENEGGDDDRSDEAADDKREDQ